MVTTNGIKSNAQFSPAFQIDGGKFQGHPPPGEALARGLAASSGVAGTGMGWASLSSRGIKALAK